MLARNDVVRKRLTISQVANKYGVHRTTIWRWIKRSEGLSSNAYIWNLSSAPKHHPKQIKPEIVERILTLRRALNRCAPIIHAHLRSEGIIVGLSTVAKVLRRYKLTRKRKQLRDYRPFPRPLANSPGDLVQIDTIHFLRSDYHRCFVYAVIDVFSRLGYAEYKDRISARISFQVTLHAQKYFGFPFRVVQTDNGGEFPSALAYLLTRYHIQLRHSRVRRPNDNAHVERFIRTLQEECFRGKLPIRNQVRTQLKQYLQYYNHHRLHLGINCQTPAHVAKVSN